MGIPSYFSHIVKNHANIIRKMNYNKTKRNNNLYMDCNSIIYDAVHNIDFNNLTETDVKTIINFVLNKIDEYILLISPDKNIFIAFDGVAPVAKLDQQRERRYKSLYQAQISKAIFKDAKPDPWNTTAITPGTNFMKELNTRCKSYFNNPAKYGVEKLLLSTTEKYGEGEHKIFEYIRDFPQEHTCDFKTIIYGLDADLIMLSINHLPVAPDTHLFRETPHFIQNINKDLEPNANYLLDIPELARIITDDMNNLSPSPSSRVYDYIFLCFFLGNDFLPHFPSVNIRTGGVDKMINAYKATIGDTKETLTDGKTIYWANVRKLVDFLAKLEEEHFKNEIKLRDKRERFFLQTDTPENIYKKFDVIPTYERETERYINPYRKGWQNRYYTALFTKSFDKNNIRMFDESEIKKICINYLEGLEWTAKYYTNGCPDWRWSYKYAYPPLFSDLIRFIPLYKTEFITPNLGENPVNELVQLCYVLPRQSLPMLPPNLYDIVLKNYEQRWYPTECEFTWAFCKYFWEAHVQLPEIELDELEKVVEEYLRIRT